MELTHTVTANTLIGLLSTIGGYSTVLVSFFGLLIGNYQSFVYDKSMLKKLYFKQKDFYSSRDDNGLLRHDD